MVWTAPSQVFGTRDGGPAVTEARLLSGSLAEIEFAIAAGTGFPSLALSGRIRYLKIFVVAASANVELNHRTFGLAHAVLRLWTQGQIDAGGNRLQC